MLLPGWGVVEERWRRKSGHDDKWTLCDNNLGEEPEKAG